MFKRALSSVFVFFVGFSAVAEPTEFEGKPFLSVYEVDLKTDAVVIGGAAILNLAPRVFANQIVRKSCPCSRDEVNSFDRPVIDNRSATADRLSDISIGLGLLAPIGLDYLDVGVSDAFQEDMIVYAETMMVSSALVSLTKYAVQRPRPLTVAGDPDYMSSNKGYLSFYSGHTSLMFSALSAASMTYTLRHGSRVWPWAIVGVLGTSVAVERVAAGKHYYTDVITGAVVGTGIGILVPWLHVNKEKRGTLLVIPSEEGPLLTWSIEF